MTRLVILLGLLLIGSAWADPQDAVVRIPSHGISGTIIETGPGRTLILTCAHGHAENTRGGLRRSRQLEEKAMVIDAPAPRPGFRQQRAGGRIRLVKIDVEADLALIELPAGPLPYVCPVAGAGFRPGRRLLSSGYDEMRIPRTDKSATILGARGRDTITREAPWHGRSGGALIDLDAGRLIGVVQAYEGEFRRPTRGIYASHASILRFLGRSGGREEPDPRYRPAPRLDLPSPGQNWSPAPGT